jgi:hypothetical protein
MFMHVDLYCICSIEQLIDSCIQGSFFHEIKIVDCLFSAVALHLSVNRKGFKDQILATTTRFQQSYDHKGK